MKIWRADIIKFVLCFIGIVIICLSIAGCASPSYVDTHRLKDYPISFVRDSLDIASAPVKWDSTDITRAVAVVGITGVLTLADKPVKHFTNGSSDKSVGNVV